MVFLFHSSARTPGARHAVKAAAQQRAFTKRMSCLLFVSRSEITGARSVPRQRGCNRRVSEGTTVSDTVAALPTCQSVSRCDRGTIARAIARTTLATVRLVAATLPTTIHGGTSLMPTLDSLKDLLEDEIKDIYDAEKQLTKALPKLAKKATAPELREAFDEHLKQTQEHIARLEQVFDQMGMPVRGKKCEGMQHLIAEGNEMIAEAKDDATRDALMIAAAQKCEHYEIASYGTIRVWANLLGKTEVAALFEDTLEEEKETDHKLTQIAESVVDQMAADRGDDEDEEDEEEGEPPRQVR